MIDEPAMLVCARVADQPDPFPGSVVSTCPECDHDIWIAESGMQAVHEGAHPRCFRCAQPHMQPGDTIEAAPGVDEELRKHLTPDLYAAVMESFNEWRMERS